MADEQQTEYAEQALKRAVWDTSEILATASTVLTFRTNTLTLNRAKLIAERRLGHVNVSIMSVRIEDVLNVNGTVGPLFGYVKINTKFTNPGEPFSMGLFARKDVLKMKRIIQGYIIALQRKIDVSQIPTDELVELLYKIGEDDQSVK